MALVISFQCHVTESLVSVSAFGQPLFEVINISSPTLEETAFVFFALICAC